MDDDIRRILEDVNVPADKIEEIIIAVNEIAKNPPKSGDKVGDSIIEVLKKEYAETDDWRKKASIAARIISAGLE